MKVFQGSSLKSLVLLGKQKGYELACVNETNAFFVLQELFPLCGIADNSIDTLHTDHQFETRLFQLYDGTLVLDGYNKLFWHNVPIDAEKLQVLPKRKRVYPAHIPERGLIRAIKYHVRKLPVYPLIQKIRKGKYTHD